MIMMEKGQYIPGTTDDSAVRRNSCIESFCTVKDLHFGVGAMAIYMM